MSYGDTLVGFVALALAFVALSIAVGPWSRPYELRTISIILDRYGKQAARGAWVAIAIAVFAAAIAILNGVRPSYANPDHATQKNFYVGELTY